MDANSMPEIVACPRCEGHGSYVLRDSAYADPKQKIKCTLCAGVGKTIEGCDHCVDRADVVLAIENDNGTVQRVALCRACETALLVHPRQVQPWTPTHRVLAKIMDRLP